MNPRKKFSNNELDSAIRFATKKLGKQNLKYQQRVAILSYLKGHDVFVNLPTGYGKSLVYQAAPFCWDYLEAVNRDGVDVDDDIIESKHTAIVVSPLISLMSDQVQTLNRNGVNAASLHRDMFKDKAEMDKIMKGGFSILFASPEALLERGDLLQNPIYKPRICGVFIDESHVIKHWGHSEGKTTAFRYQYGHLAVLRSMLPSKTPFVALTATATSEVKKFIVCNLALKDTVYIQESPDRPNIKNYIFHTKQTKMKTTFSWLIDELRSKGPDCPRYIIYCRTIEDCSQLFALFENAIGRSPPTSRSFAMYHSETEGKLCDIIVDSFKDAKGHVRVLFASIAFGLGIDCKGLYNIIHYGPPKSVDEYIQESCRAGRDGQQSTSVLLHYPGSTGKIPVKEEMKTLLKTTQKCRREYILEKFDQQKQWDLNRSAHECCDVCAINCSCGACQEPEWIKAIRQLDCNIVPSLRQRHVSHDDEVKVRAKCLEYRDLIIKESVSEDFATGNLYCGSDIACGVPVKTIEKIVQECNIVWSFDEFKARYNLFGTKNVKSVWSLLQEIVGNAPVCESEEVQQIDLQMSVYDVEPEFDNIPSDEDNELQKALLPSDSDSD